ncbi:hypothetical protein D5086_032950 [Populus alba]|uniref:Uncharacterized protein n=1 Tax=Populus alba TaxID=43335 RepID=A0ACC4AFF8_POPAL
MPCQNITSHMVKRQAMGILAGHMGSIVCATSMLTQLDFTLVGQLIILVFSASTSGISIVSKSPSELEVILGVIKSYCKAQLENEVVSAASLQIHILEGMRKEYGHARSLAVAQAQLFRPVVEEVFVICGDSDEISSHVSTELVRDDELKGIYKNMAKE